MHYPCSAKTYGPRLPKLLMQEFLILFLLRFLGEENNFTVIVMLLLKGLALFHAGDEQLLGFLQGRRPTTCKKNMNAENQHHLPFVFSRVGNLEYPIFSESITSLPFLFHGPDSIIVNGTNEIVFPPARDSCVREKNAKYRSQIQKLALPIFEHCTGALQFLK